MTRTRRAGASLIAALALIATTMVATGPAGAGPGPAAPSAPGGAPAPEPFDGPAVPTRPDNAVYVGEAYQSLLGRAVEPGGEQFWGGLLDEAEGLPTVNGRAGFTGYLARSAESVRPRVAAIYDAFGRPADAGGLTFWTAAVRGGRSLESVEAYFFGSAEFYARSGGTDEGFVTGLYEGLLGRSPAGGEESYWVDELGDGMARSTVAGRIARSTERSRRVVRNAFDVVLARPPSSGELTFTTVALVRSAAERLGVLASLSAGDQAYESGCDPLMGYVFGEPTTGECLLPFPNDYFTQPDPTTDTGRRIAFKPTFFTANAGGAPFQPAEWNRNDGFSPGSALLTQFPRVDLEASNLPPITDIGASLEDDSGVVVIDTQTRERWPVWAELDANDDNPDSQRLIIRPGRNFLDGHRYVVGLVDLQEFEGTVPAPGQFEVYRDGLPAPSRRVEERRSHMEDVITTLTDDGVTRGDLTLAWDFTVASTRNIAERAVTMRDDAFNDLGDASPGFSVTGNEDVVNDEGEQEGFNLVDGTFEVPQYLTGEGAPGSRLTEGRDNLPVRNGSFTADFTCTVPDKARDEPGRPSLYGHGLLGSRGEVDAGNVVDMAKEHNFVFCATDWEGFSSEDIANTVGILQNLSTFPELADRTQQGFINFLFLARLMANPDGLASDPAFQNDDGDAVFTGEVFYDGNSQGGILGGSLMALSTDVTKGVLGVPGMNYSTLLRRSVDFDTYAQIYEPAYPNRADQLMGLTLLQMLWDRAEADGYANHLTSDPLPGTPAKDVLMQVAFSDHQVANITADVEARTIDAFTSEMPLADGRSPDVTPLWNIPREELPRSGSAIIYWDSGNPPPPTTNTPPRGGDDPHGDPRSDPDARVQKSAFLSGSSEVIDVCEGSPCQANDTLDH